MEKYITSPELEEMKQQICLLKEKLEKQTIINDNMIRQAMQQKVSRMHKDAITMIVVAIIGIPYCFFFFMLVGFSYWLAAGTVLFLLACLVKLNQNKKKLSRIRTLLNENLVECGKSVLLLKKETLQSFKIMMPILAAWVIWFFAEIFFVLPQDDHDFIISITCGSLVGLLIGLGLGISKHKKDMKTIKDILLQIKDLENN